jgi:hypothetical protein
LIETVTVSSELPAAVRSAADDEEMTAASSRSTFGVRLQTVLWMSEEFKAPQDVLPQVFEDLERIYGTESVPPLIRVCVDWRLRTVRFEPAVYEINLRLIRDSSDILEWVKHLSEKNWITVKLLTEFIDAATTNLLWVQAGEME